MNKKITCGFEQLLLEISSQLISLPIHRIDGVIEDTQDKVCQAMGLDLSTLWQWSDRDHNLMRCTHLYTIPGGPSRPREVNAAESFPWVLAKMMAGETLAFSNQDLPPEAALDRRSREAYGVESSVVTPLLVGGKRIIGVISYETLGRHHAWTQEEVERLRLVTDILANSLNRKHTERKLIESEERLILAADSAEAGLWEFDYLDEMFWVTRKACEIFNLVDRQFVSFADFEKTVHPEDLAHVKQALAAAFQEKTALDTEYRIISHSGDDRWICSRGRPHFDAHGAPKKMLGVSLDISDRKQLELQQNEYLREICELKKQVESENLYLREDLRVVQGFKDIIGESGAIKSTLRSAKQVAGTSATVLLTGETGTGKGVLANAIHQMSQRSGEPLVTVNCAALPTELIESELFGRVKGAYTSADMNQAGRFEVANKGTLFLDEIGELSLSMQSALLRVLQDGTLERLGSSSTITVDVRVIVATSRNLEDLVRSGDFRQDLYYRLNVFPIRIPPLRERVEDIPLLAEYFVRKYSRKLGKKINRIPKRTLKTMVTYAWPGNIRELEHFIERGVIMSNNGSLAENSEQLMPLEGKTGSHSIKNMAAAEQDHILRALSLANWKIEGPSGAAHILDMHPSTLRYRLHKWGIKRPSQPLPSDIGGTNS